MKIHLVALAAIAVLLAGGTGVALASSSEATSDQDPCAVATEAVAVAQSDLDAAVAAALERARELGIADDKVNELLGLVDGGLDQAEIDRAVELFRESGAADEFDLISDGQLVLKIADTGRALFEAENERGAACPSPIAPPTTAAPVDEVDCLDFESHDEAQAKLDEDPSDPHGLDEDGDGQACDEIEYEDGVVPDDDEPQVPVVPDEPPNTGGGPA